MRIDLDQLTPKELGQLFPILLAEHDPKWTTLFEAEKATIEQVSGRAGLIRIEHIGSTAAPFFILAKVLVTGN
jgi:GrpB-like predicted nucleotidyltransferase (UPF0157 family)